MVGTRNDYVRRGAGPRGKAGVERGHRASVASRKGRSGLAGQACIFGTFVRDARRTLGSASSHLHIASFEFGVD